MAKLKPHTRNTKKYNKNKIVIKNLSIEDSHEESLEGVEEHLDVHLEEVRGGTQTVWQPDETHVVHGEQRDQY
jgi:hypothetical protein